MAAYFKIDGTDIAQYIQDGGLSWENNDIDDDDSGRTMDKMMQRGNPEPKDKYIITCRPLKKEESMLVIGLLKGKRFVTLDTTLSPAAERVVLTMYNSARKNTLHTVYNKEDDTWEGLNFSLIER